MEYQGGDLVVMVLICEGIFVRRSSVGWEKCTVIDRCRLDGGRRNECRPGVIERRLVK